jgi:GGDEF domain-containing protein
MESALFDRPIDPSSARSPEGERRVPLLSDELTGLYNRRGFIEAGAWLLEAALRERQVAHLAYFAYFGVDHLGRSGDAPGDPLIRRTADLLRGLFPGHGVDEIIGRMGGAEFAALTTRTECAARSTILLRAGWPRLRRIRIAVPALRIGVARFDPRCPLGIGELLADAREATQRHKETTRIASSGPNPPPGPDALNGLGAVQLNRRL